MRSTDRTKRHIQKLWRFCERHMEGNPQLAIPHWQDLSEGELCRALWELCVKICESKGLLVPKEDG